jgi:hypothetical protein
LANCNVAAEAATHKASAWELFMGEMMKYFFGTNSSGAEAPVGSQ